MNEKSGIIDCVDFTHKEKIMEISLLQNEWDIFDGGL